MKRIKYHRFADFLFTDWFTVGPNIVVRGIISPELLCNILTIDAEIIYQMRASSMREAKTWIRSALLDSGVKLEDEIRRHTTP